ncbi:mannitol-1-phosphate 5-dehydrogenase [Microbacterium sp. STN6]|uniref:mannitol-1-phosphate 5-dehydrogenase n=1 Tax=Microbacterium sp. STN6 TaxID=2995588 RepID=UPI0022608A10|nr:mannitol-1-phosphate 5-dehydrogenase [Microbacterium sp. STN6]MCX7523236.1 mannitol-1-phosphate 5-dehydrogenase [Microbacterium sp. STN6]
MKAVHFGAGNIGRGFVGLILHKAGYDLVFADVNEQLIDALAAADSYRVHEVGANSRDWSVTGFRALNSSTHESDVVAEVATADVVTCAVGPNILRFIAPVIASGILARDSSLPPLTVMACENAINATDALKAHVLENAQADAAAVTGRAIFANTAVDRIVPNQDPSAGLDVTVEDFFEWAVEAGPFDGAPPLIPDAHFVDDLAPYIERKLFTVNTGHATLAYHAAAAGAATLAEAMTIPSVADEVRAVLGETKALLVAKHGFAEAVQQEYVDRNLARFANPHLPDTPERVGRQPLRKLSRHERFVGPAAELAERNLGVDALLRAIGAALRFDVESDLESVELRALLVSASPRAFTEQVTGLDAQHPLFDRVVDVVAAARAAA